MKFQESEQVIEFTERLCVEAGYTPEQTVHFLFLLSTVNNTVLSILSLMEKKDPNGTKVDHLNTASRVMKVLDLVYRDMIEQSSKESTK
jgi:hypothetical protein